MALNARDFIVREQMAKDADTIIPPIPISGRAYRNVNLDPAAVAIGNQYDQVWESSKNNQIDYEISGAAKQATKMGVVIWSPLEDYVEGSIQMGTNGRLYRCDKPHGPKTEDPASPGNHIGPKDPTVAANTGEGKYWLDFAEWLLVGGTAGSYLAIPDTLCLRSPGDARTQVGDPIDDMDAVNKRWAVDYFHKNQGFGNVQQPTIIAPEDNAVQQSLSFPITISPIELITGGELSPLFTNYIVKSDTGKRIVGPVSVAYTTTPEIWVPESCIGQTVQVIVQYEDDVNGTSQWSDPKPVKIASVLANPVPVTSPARGSIGVIPVGLTVTIGEGSWSDDSPFTGSQSRIELFDEATGRSLYDSGWTPYRTEFPVPDGILTTSKGYWVRGQHRAASAPAANPGAVLTSPVVYRDSLAASYFYTTGPIPPNTSNLKHTIPSTVLKGTQVTVKIFGAVSLDGGKITYTINQNTITGGVGFSKYTGIGENEEIEMTVPNIAGVTADASLRITAVSSFGAESTPVIVNIIILGQTVWVFKDVGQLSWECLANGEYDVLAGGGGGMGINATTSAGVTGNLGGGGGGCAWLKNVKLTKGTSYGVTVGAGGRYVSSNVLPSGSSAFGGLIVGEGGGLKVQNDHSVQVRNPGVGSGGDVNTSGGYGGQYAGVGAVVKAGGGGGAGITNGGNGAGFAASGNASGGTAGDLPDGIDAATGSKGGNLSVSGSYAGAAYGGAGSIAGGGSGNAGFSTSNYTAGGSGSVVVIFRRGIVSA